MFSVMENYGVRDLTRQIASTVRGAMAKYGVTQAEMAEAVGVSQSQLSKMVRGTRPIDIDQLNAMCWALGLEIGEVVSEAESFLMNYDRPHPARVVYVDEGLRRDVPYVTNEEYGSPLVPSIGRKRGDVTPPIDTEDLFNADLTEDFELAASDDDTAIDPDRGTP